MLRGQGLATDLRGGEPYAKIGVAGRKCETDRCDDVRGGIGTVGGAGAGVADGRAADGSAVAARRKFSLEHIRALLEALGEPQQKFASVLIAGTNGKGSTAATLASIAMRRGSGRGCIRRRTWCG